MIPNHLALEAFGYAAVEAVHQGRLDILDTVVSTIQNLYGTHTKVSALSSTHVRSPQEWVDQINSAGGIQQFLPEKSRVRGHVLVAAIINELPFTEAECKRTPRSNNTIGGQRLHKAIEAFLASGQLQRSKSSSNSRYLYFR